MTNRDNASWSFKSLSGCPLTLTAGANHIEIATPNHFAKIRFPPVREGDAALHRPSGQECSPWQLLACASPKLYAKGVLTLSHSLALRCQPAWLPLEDQQEPQPDRRLQFGRAESCGQHDKSCHTAPQRAWHLGNWRETAAGSDLLVGGAWPPVVDWKGGTASGSHV